MESVPDEKAGQEMVRFTPDRSNMGVEFYDIPTVKPLEVNFGSHKLDFLPDNHYCVLYRDAPEYNRIEHTDEEGNTRTIYDNSVLIEWLTGLILGEYNTEVPRNRKRKSMRDLCGFNSQVFISSRPSPEEKEKYELSQVWDLYPALGELSVQSVIDGWEAEGEEDEAEEVEE